MKTKSKKNKVEMKRRVRLATKIDQRIQEEIDKGISGVSLSKKAFRIKNEEVGLYKQKSLSNYKEIKLGDKLNIRNQLIATGKIESFVKIQRRSQLYTLIITTQQLKDIALKSFDMFGMVFSNLMRYKENEKFPCELQENAIAWISKRADDQKEIIYRYYSKKDGETIGLSLFDLIEIVDGVNPDPKMGFRNAIMELARMLDLDDLKDGWVLEQERRYNRNLGFILTDQAKLEVQFPILFNYLKAEYLQILVYMNDYGIIHADRLMSHGNEAIFYVSTTHIADDHQIALDQPEISRAINLLTVLGLLEKIPHEHLLKEQLEIVDGIMEGKRQSSTVSGKSNQGISKNKPITFYRIPDYVDQGTFEEAEIMVKKLMSFGIRTERAITKKSLLKHFDIEFVRKVYLPKYTPKKWIKTVNPLEDEIPF